MAVVVVRKDFLEENPEIVSAFLEKHQEATDDIAANAADAAAVVNEEINSATGKSLTESVLKSAFEKIIISTEINEDAISDFGDISVEQGFVSEKYEDIFADGAEG